MSDPLSLSHRAELEHLSNISPEQIVARGYRTVKAHELPDAFADYQRRDGLLIPLRSVRGEIESYQLKPDVPRLGTNGKPIKYETAANCRQILDVPQAAIRHLGNPVKSIIITEGAKKVDSAVSNGLPTTIGLQGVYGWRGKNEHGGSAVLPDWEGIALNGRKVCIAFDNDVMTKDSVRDALDRLAAFLTRRGAQVAYLLLPQNDDGKKTGLDDWFALGYPYDSIMPYMVRQLPPRTQAPTPAPTSPEPVVLERPYVLPMRDITSRNIDWLWPNWLPKGMLTLLGGYAGDGKSTVTMQLASSFSTGGALPDGSTAPTVNTLLLVAEDDLSHVVKPRLELHGADTDRIFTLQHIEQPNGDIRSFNLKRDIPYLRQVVEQHSIGLIVIDPLSSYLAASDRNNEGEVRDTLQPLVQLMEEMRVAVIGIMHIGKNDGQQRAMQKLMGSTAFTALARCVWMVNALPEEYQHQGEPVRKMLGVSKSNYAVPPVPLVFSREVDGPLQYHGASPVGIEEVFRWKPGADVGGKAQAAEAWLEEQLAEGPMPVATMVNMAKTAGISRASLYRAGKKLGVARGTHGTTSICRLDTGIDEVA